MFLKKIVLGILIAVVVIVVIGMGLLQQSPRVQKLEMPETPSPEKPPLAVIKISEKDLVKEYEQNPIAADEKYKDRIIITVGTIADIREVEDGKAQILIYPKEGSMELSCIFNDKKEITPVKKGEKIAIKGRNEGIKRIGWFRLIWLEDCHLLPLEKVKEFKAEFDQKTGILKIQQFGSDLKVLLFTPKGAKETIKSIEYFESNISVNIYEALAGLYPWTFGRRPVLGEYRLLVQEDRQALYEERFKTEGLEKAKLEEIEITGEWATFPSMEKVGYGITEVILKFSNPREVPILTKVPEAIEIYTYPEKRLIAFLRYFGRNYEIILPAKEVTFKLIGSPLTPVTTDPRGGDYQLILEIYSEYPNVKERVLFREVTTVIKVPPYKP